ncbi:MAG: DNA repair protein RadC [Deltaproteobacteria bacterium]|nr:DNA repair protein RadC [Deltaproteobacteria bacterium]
MAPSKKDDQRGHRGRLREKYLAQGLDSLTDQEVIELLLTLSTPLRDCKPMAREAVRRFGNLRGVLAADPAELAEVDGLGPRNILPLRLIQDTARRFLRDKLLDRDFLHSAREVFDYLYQALRDRKSEVFQVIFLNAKNGVLAVEEPFQGGAVSSFVDIQVVVGRALALNAAGLVCAHNHPSGQPQPSDGDVKVTRELVLACKAVGLKLVDHLIIGENRYFSFSEGGHIKRFEDEFETFKRSPAQPNRITR